MIRADIRKILVESLMGNNFSVKDYINVGYKEKINTLDGNTITFSRTGDHITLNDGDNYIWFPASELNIIQDVIKRDKLSSLKIGSITFGYDPDTNRNVIDDFDSEDIYYDPKKKEKEVLMWFDNGQSNISFFVREYNLKKMIGILKRFNGGNNER